MNSIVFMNRIKMKMTKFQSKFQNRELNYFDLKFFLIVRLFVDDLLKTHLLNVDFKLFEFKTIELNNQLFVEFQQKFKNLKIHFDNRKIDFIDQILLIENDLLKCVFFAYVT